VETSTPEQKNKPPYGLRSLTQDSCEQQNPVYLFTMGENPRNSARIDKICSITARNGISLAVFPKACFLDGSLHQEEGDPVTGCRYDPLFLGRDSEKCEDPGISDFSPHLIKRAQ